MTVKLALFPLQLVAYPGEAVNLHIFEPRYRQLIEDAERDGITFGIPTVIDGRLRPIATEVTLSQVAKRYPGGESDVRTRGNRIFHIDEFYHQAWGRDYPGGQVTFLAREEDEDFALNREILDLTREIYRVLKIEKEVPQLTGNFRSYDVAHYIGFTLEQEYEVLTLTDSLIRQRYIIDHLKEMRPDVEKQLEMKARAKLNGHFKQLTPPDF